MKCMKIKGLGVFLGAIFILGCNDGTTPYSTDPVPEQPAIQSLTVHPLNVLHGSTVTAVAVVNGAENDWLEYEWSVSSGSLIGSTLGREVLWATPDAGSDAVITCTIKNESGSDCASTHVYLASQDAPTTVQLSRVQTAEDPYITGASPSPDGGCYVIGVFSGGSEEIWMAKLSASGAPVWEQIVWNASIFSGNPKIAATPDGGCIVAGLAEYRPGYNGSRIMKLNESGDVLWEINTAYTMWYDVDVTGDGNCLLVGRDSEGSQLLRVTEGGEVIDQQTIQLSVEPYSVQSYVKIASTSDGGFIFCGSDVPMMGISTSTMIKFSADNEIVWTKQFGNEAREVELRDVMDTKSGYIVASGCELSFHADSTRNYDAFITGIDYSGNTLWTRRFPEIEAIWTTLSEFEDGSLGAGFGSFESFSLCSFDGGGNLLWMKQHEVQSSDVAIFGMWKYANEFRALARASWNSEYAPGFMISLN